MHVHTLKNWQHSHDFSANNDKGEQRAQYVLFLTAITMVVEIIAGTAYGSMALLADGWHMSTHVAAFVITIFAYRYSRKHEKNPEYAFGTGKVNVLGGFASAVALAVVALLMAVESLERIITPEAIHFNEAIIVAGIGLLINIISALLLKDNHSHSHHHDHAHTHHDHNLKAAYVHVLADALTSLFAIGALFAGKYLGWEWLDATMGIVGAIIITRWSYSLLKQAAPVLLDASIEEEYQQKIKKVIENNSDNRVSDMHIWRVGATHYAAIIALVTHYPEPVEHYKMLLNDFKELSHITIEVNKCTDEPCVPQ
jgi:cation diffusion facilitator family transporter